MTTLFSDAALKNPEDDELEVLPFVRRLISPLLEWPTEEALVLGLYAPWGYGKTTVLNVLEHSLQQATASGRRAIVVRFNPWLYTTPEALLASFFGTVAASVKRFRWALTEPQIKRGLRSGLKGIGTVVPVIAGAAGTPRLAPLAGAGIAGLEQLLKNGEENLAKHKARAAKALRAAGKRRQPVRLVVLIDDVDRADPPEVFAILKLVKLLADLPNISYVLAMDEGRVRALIDREYAGNEGRDYLEKIVQVAVYLPLLTDTSLRNLVISSLTKVVEEAGLSESVLFGEDWEVLDFYADTIGARVRTLRDRARFVNAFRFFLLSGDIPDINLRDALLVTFLQVFYPDVYGRVRENKPFLTGTSSVGNWLLLRDKPASEIEPELRERYLRIVTGEESAPQGTSDSEASFTKYLTRPALAPIHKTLRQLFPSATISGMRGGDERPAHRRENRIFLASRFDRYFRLSLHNHDVPDRIVDEFLGRIVARVGTAGQREEAVESGVRDFKNCVELASAVHHQAFVDKLLDRIDELEPELAGQLIEMVIKAHGTVADNLLPILKALVDCASRRTSSFEDYADKVGVALLPVLRTLPDPAQALTFAEAYIGPRGITFSDGMRRQIADALLARMDEYVESGRVVFEEGPYRTFPIISRWGQELQVAELPLTPMAGYLRGIIERQPRFFPRLLRILFAVSRDNGPGHVFRTISREADIHRHQRMEGMFGAPWLTAQGERFPRDVTGAEDEDYELVGLMLEFLSSNPSTDEQPLSMSDA